MNLSVNTSVIVRPNSVGKISCFLRRVVLQSGNSLLTGAESRVTLSLPSEKPDLKKFSNPAFLIEDDRIIAILYQSTFYEIEKL